MERRTFLKIVGCTIGTAAINPFKAFAQLAPEIILSDNSNSFSLGLGNVCVGSSTSNLYNINTCLKKSIGLAEIKAILSNNPYTLIEDLQASFCGYTASIECLFKKRPTLIGNVGRVETVAIYPDGHTFMAMIFPKAQIKQKKDMFIFTSIPVKHKAWKNMPLGRFYFGTR